MKILALDLGISCTGYAVLENHGGTESLWTGVFRPKAKASVSRGQALCIYADWLDAFIDMEKPNLVAWEDVQFSTSRDQSQVFGALSGYLAIACWRRNIPHVDIPTGEIKRAATGWGGGKKANKGAIVRAARERWPGVEFETDDAADAAWLATVAARGDI